MLLFTECDFENINVLHATHNGAKYLQTHYCGKEFWGYKNCVQHILSSLKPYYKSGVIHLIQKCHNLVEGYSWWLQSIIKLNYINLILWVVNMPLQGFFIGPYQQVNKEWFEPRCLMKWMINTWGTGKIPFSQHSIKIPSFANQSCNYSCGLLRIMLYPVA